MQRHPARDTLALSQRNVYIVPTGAGWLFAALLAVLLLASINYQLNLGYLLTFVLAGIGLTSMHTTHATLRGLQGQLSVGEPAFAGEAVAVTVRLTSPNGRPRYGIGLRWDGATPTWVDVEVARDTSVALACPAPHRGCHALPRLTLETRYPYGLFRAWSHWRAASPLIVWPRPEHPSPPLPWTDGPAEQGVIARTGHAEPDGVRPYRRGDALAQVVWKKSAQTLASGAGLITRERQTRTATELTLAWADTAGLDDERRLSRLAAWIVAAEQAGVRWRLSLPGRELAGDLGAAHRRAGLTELARWAQPTAAT